MTDTAADKVIIRELVDAWAIYRDARLWDRFRTVWHAEGRMMATWFQGGYEEFIKVNNEGWARGVRILHFLGGCAIEVSGHRGIAQTKMTISQRAPVEDVICDVLCTGRFYDFFEKRDGRWGLVLRQPIYEKDRLDPVDPAAKLSLDQKANSATVTTNCETANNSVVNPGTREVNPVYSSQIDLVGHRYISEHDLGVVLGLELQITF